MQDLVKKAILPSSEPDRIEFLQTLQKRQSWIKHQSASVDDQASGKVSGGALQTWSYPMETLTIS